MTNYPGMTISISLPDGVYRLREPLPPPPSTAPATSRIAYAAAHVVADPLADNTPGQPAVIDWDSTLNFRRHLWSLGLGVADAMDTAQRGMGLEWAATAELIRRSAKAADGPLVCGAGTDQIVGPAADLATCISAYEEQVALIESAGAGVVLMASRALASVARGPDDYFQVYGKILRQVRNPVILHWLGPMFDPALEGYWGSTDLDTATDAVSALITEHADKIDGIKVSLLDADREIDLRRRLPAGVRLYTGDDFNYPALILGDEQSYSDALLGIFDPIAIAAATALQALDNGDQQAYEAALSPTVPLARHCFATPTFHYKTGVTFIAYLAGHQSHFVMVDGRQSARSVPHLVELFRLADAAGVLPDPELAVQRMTAFLATAGWSP
jgi:hypothetical protein